MFVHLSRFIRQRTMLLIFVDAFLTHCDFRLKHCRKCSEKWPLIYLYCSHIHVFILFLNRKIIFVWQLVF